VRNFGAGLNIINQSGDITSEGVGLDTQSLGAASVINVNATGNITSINNAIDILAGNNVSVSSSGRSQLGRLVRHSNAIAFQCCHHLFDQLDRGHRRRHLGQRATRHHHHLHGRHRGGNGIQATSIGGPVTIFMSDGSIGATATGIVVTSQLDASVSVFGNVQADMSGIEVLSLGGNIYVSLAPTGVVTGGVNGTAGVLMNGAGNNVLWNFGSISSQNGMAILATVGNDEFLAPGWLLGGAIAYERSTISTGNLASSEGDRAQAGLVAKGLFDDTTIAGAVFGGYGWFDVSRPIGLPQPGVTAESEQQIGFSGAGLRLSHMLDQGGWYVKPMADATLTYISYGDFRETGAGVANLIVEGEHDTVINLAAALEVGSVLAIDADRTARPYLRVGITKATESDFSLTSSFEAAPLSVAPFIVTSHMDDVLASIGAGLDLFDVGI
jgi:Autotransporter beta-domain